MVPMAAAGTGILTMRCLIKNMLKKYRKYIIITTLILLGLFLGYLGYGYYVKYQSLKLIKEIFPDQPLIPEISDPKPFTDLRINNVYFPNLIKNHIYYFNNLGQFYDYDTENKRSEIINEFSFNLNTIIHVKSNDRNKILVGKISNDLIPLAEEEEDLEDLRNNDLEYIVFNLATKTQLEIYSTNRISEAFWSADGDRIFLLTNNTMGEQFIEEFNSNNRAIKNIYKFDRMISPIPMDILPENCLYLLDNSEISLNRICLDTDNNNLQKIVNSCTEALIAPSNNYALVNLYNGKELNSAIINLRTNKLIYNLHYLVSSPNSTWSTIEDKLFLITGENLKVGEEQAFLNRRASYVFFEYTPINNELQQLSNHYYDDPLDVSSLMYDAENKYLYFINTYFSRNILYNLSIK